MKSVYDIKVDTDALSEEGVFTVSLVDKPAIQSDFLYFQEEEGAKTYHFNEEKGEIVGAVLIPEKLIIRKNEKLGTYYVKFSKETIEDIQYKMSKDNFFNYFNLDHSIPVSDVYLLETWIKESENDKSTDYGFSELPVGSMFFKVKIDNEEVKTQIKNGEINGFSVEIKASLLPVVEQLQTETMEETNFEARLAALELALAEKNEEPKMVRVDLAEDMAATLTKLVGTKDGYYQIYVSVTDGAVNYADMQSSHYESLMQEQIENSTESTEELAEEPAPVATEETLEEEPTPEPVAEELEAQPQAEEAVTEELSEQEAEAELLKSRTETLEEEVEPVMISRLDGRFSKAIDDVINKYL